MSFATFEDFTNRKGAVDDDEQQTIVTTLLEDATALILSEVEGSEETWVTAPDSNEPPAIVKAICVEVAYRAWSNPDALAQTSQADSSLSYVRGGSPDALFLTESEIRTLERAAGAGASGMSVVTLVSPYSGDDGDDFDEVGDL